MDDLTPKSPFEEISDDYTEEEAKVVQEASLVKLHQQAVANDWPVEICFTAERKAISDGVDICNYDNYLDLLKETIANEIIKLKHSRVSPQKMIDDKLYEKYNSTAVYASEVLTYVTCGNSYKEKLNVELYESESISVLLQLECKWLQEVIDNIIANWSSPYISEYVEHYLKTIGVKEDEYESNKKTLIENLPDTIRNEDSPETYKQWRAIDIICNGDTRKKFAANDGSDTIVKDDFDISGLSDAIFGETTRAIDYSAKLENYIDDGVPVRAADAYATEEVLEDMPEEESEPFMTKAGSFAGRVIGLKYEAANNFEEAMRESLGPHADEWIENREKVKQRKQELREKKLEQKQELKDRKLELEQELKLKEQGQKILASAQPVQNVVNPVYTQQGRHSQRYGQPQYATNGYRASGRRGTAGGGRDFAPYIPLPVLMAGVHLIVALFIFLLFGNKTGTFASIGLVVASLGFLKQKMQEPKAVPVIIGGYAIVVVAFLLNF